MPNGSTNLSKDPFEAAVVKGNVKRATGLHPVERDGAIVDKPVQFASLQGGKYSFGETVRDGLTASYL